MKLYKTLSIVIALIYCSSAMAKTECPTDTDSETVQQNLFLLTSETVSKSHPDKSLEEAKNELFNQYKACIDKEKADLEKIAKSTKDAKEEAEATMKLAGFNWGLGLAFMSLHGKAITDAKIIDGVVRTTKTQSRSAALLFETHFFVRKPKWKDDWGSDIGIGPFVAIRLADETKGVNVGAYGIGLMVGFRNDPTKSGSWNIGLGYFADTQVKEFGSGVVEGQALPGTESSIRYNEIDRNGTMIIVSSTW